MCHYFACERLLHLIAFRALRVIFSFSESIGCIELGTSIEGFLDLFVLLYVLRTGLLRQSYPALSSTNGT
jgi:hypothetical protein